MSHFRHGNWNYFVGSNVFRFSSKGLRSYKSLLQATKDAPRNCFLRLCASLRETKKRGVFLEKDNDCFVVCGCGDPWGCRQHAPWT
jgi:hypothetical protein